MSEELDRAAPLHRGAVCPLHGDPAIFVCVRCGNYACDRCRSEDPAYGALCPSCVDRTAMGVVPWERRRDLGFFGAFARTTYTATFAPTAFFHAPSPRAGSLAPVAYGVLAYALAPSVGMLLYAALLVVMLSVADPVTGELFANGGFPAAIGMCVGFAVMFAWIPVAGAVGIVVDAAITHAVLRLTGSVARPFDATLRAVSYANAPYVLALVPCVGWVLAPFWMMAVEVIALRETHRVSTARAALAVLGYRVVLYGGIALLYAVLIGVMVAGMDVPAAPR